MATFAIVTLIGGVGDEHHSIERYQGLARRQPWLGAALAVLLLSQLGAPLTTGFYAKFAVLASVVDAGGGALALIALISAAIAAFFYLRWAMALYSDDGPEADPRRRAALDGRRHRLRRVGHVGLRCLARTDRHAGPARDGALHAVRRVAIATSISDDVNLDPDAELLLDALDVRRRRRLDVRLGRPVHPVERLRTDGHPLDVGLHARPRRLPRVGPRHRAPARTRIRSSSTRPTSTTSRTSNAGRTAIVPSTFCDVGGEPVFPDGRFVVKPTVGAGSIDAEKYAPGEHDRAGAHVRALHAAGRDAMIQPYVSSIDEDGERALVFIDGEFSHAMTKGAMLNTARRRPRRAVSS